MIPTKIKRYGTGRFQVKPTQELFSSSLFDVTEEGVNGLRVVEFVVKPTTLLTLTDEAGQGQYGSLKLCDLPHASIGKIQANINVSLVLPAPFIDSPVVTMALGSAAAASGAALATDKVDASAAKTITVTAAKTVELGWTDSETPKMLGTSLYANIRVADNAAHETTEDIPIASLNVRLVVFP